jgi:hypothetical protein
MNLLKVKLKGNCLETYEYCELNDNWIESVKKLKLKPNKSDSTTVYVELLKIITLNLDVNLQWLRNLK